MSLIGLREEPETTLPLRPTPEGERSTSPLLLATLRTPLCIKSLVGLDLDLGGLVGDVLGDRFNMLCGW